MSALCRFPLCPTILISSFNIMILKRWTSVAFLQVYDRLRPDDYEADERALN